MSETSKRSPSGVEYESRINSRPTPPTNKTKATAKRTRAKAKPATKRARVATPTTRFYELLTDKRKPSKADTERFGVPTGSQPFHPISLIGDIRVAPMKVTAGVANVDKLDDAAFPMRIEGLYAGSRVRAARWSDFVNLKNHGGDVVRYSGFSAEELAEGATATSQNVSISAFSIAPQRFTVATSFSRQLALQAPGFSDALSEGMVDAIFAQVEVDGMSSIFADTAVPTSVSTAAIDYLDDCLESLGHFGRIQVAAAPAAALLLQRAAYDNRLEDLFEIVSVEGATTSFCIASAIGNVKLGSWDGYRVNRDKFSDADTGVISVTANFNGRMYVQDAKRSIKGTVVS